MGLNFAYTQYYNQGLEFQALKSVTRNILSSDAKAETVSNDNEKAILDLYNGELDSFVARQIALSNSGLKIETNKDVKRIDKVVDNFSNNFFMNGSVSRNKADDDLQATKTQTSGGKYLFINVA